MNVSTISSVPDTILSQVLLGLSHRLCDLGQLFTPSWTQFGSLMLRKGTITEQLLAL